MVLSPSGLSKPAQEKSKRRVANEIAAIGLRNMNIVAGVQLDSREGRMVSSKRWEESFHSTSLTGPTMKAQDRMPTRMTKATMASGQAKPPVLPTRMPVTAGEMMPAKLA